MGVRWGSGSIVLALTLVACVPSPAGRTGPSGEATVAAPTPSPTPEPTASGPSSSPSFVLPTPTASPDFLVYVVKRGDTLSSIARRFGTTEVSLAYWNRVTYPSLDPESSAYKPDRLEIGWVLQLVRDHEVDPEDLPTLSPSPTPRPTRTPVPEPSPTATS